MRDFAVSELKLPDNASYRRYADLKRNAAVWNVVAAPELSLKLEDLVLPGRRLRRLPRLLRPGRGRRVGRRAARARAEVSVYGVPAYSTLGLRPTGSAAIRCSTPSSTSPKASWRG